MTASKRIDSGRLRTFTKQVLESAGVRGADAALTSETLVRSNLRGTDSHGVRLLPIYVDLIIKGEFNPRPVEKRVSDSAATVLLDGGGGLGQPVSCRGMEAAIEKAATMGVGLTVVRNSHHFGAAAPYALQAVEAGLVGISMSNTSLSMAAHGGMKRVLGNNPIAMAAPAGEAAPFCFDMATSIAAWGKVVSHIMAGEPIPAGWCLDKSGRPTTDGREGLDGGLILPAAGPKGAGLASFIDIMTGVLGGGLFGFEIGSDGGCLERSSHCFIAVDVSRFMPRKQFEKRLQRAMSELEDSEADVRVAGTRAHETERRRLKEGIPIPAEVRSRLVKLAGRVGIPLEF